MHCMVLFSRPFSLLHEFGRFVLTVHGLHQTFTIRYRPDLPTSH